MSDIKEFLTQDHRQCDEAFAQMEESVAKKSEDAISKFKEFRRHMLRHFDREEKVMFPAFENKTGMSEGPTSVMRNEHEQMRHIMTQMLESLDVQNDERFFGLSETLMMLTQQHNMKEEQMLYTMAQQHLACESDAIVNEMQAL
ncbi:hemerythrin domain-containing protein [Sulfurimonas sp. MAG313]|nr:hemerythrin domain-containing protein [Sulfurimonas sp. MAG313]MDF1880221.1 hemerythrin domain-containing protein [Sulfurimonas sp. MAG313]